MYNRLYKHLSENNILYRKQFGFQEKLSTERAIMQLVDQINFSFEKNFYTHLCIKKSFFFFKSFFLSNKKIMELQWFKSYLQNGKQFTAHENFSASYIKSSCGVLQGSILGPLLFLV